MRHQSRLSDPAAELLGGESREQVRGEVPNRGLNQLRCRYPDVQRIRDS